MQKERKIKILVKTLRFGKEVQNLVGVERGLSGHQNMILGTHTGNSVVILWLLRMPTFKYAYTHVHT